MTAQPTWDDPDGVVPATGHQLRQLDDGRWELSRGGVPIVESGDVLSPYGAEAWARWQITGDGLRGLFVVPPRNEAEGATWRDRELYTADGQNELFRPDGADWAAGPMVQPLTDHHPLDQQVAAALDRLALPGNEALAAIAEQQGRRESDRLAAEAAARRLDAESSAEISAASGPWDYRPVSATDERRREIATATRTRPGDYPGIRRDEHTSWVERFRDHYGLAIDDDLTSGAQADDLTSGAQADEPDDVISTHCQFRESDGDVR